MRTRLNITLYVFYGLLSAPTLALVGYLRAVGIHGVITTNKRFNGKAKRFRSKDHFPWPDYRSANKTSEFQLETEYTVLSLLSYILCIFLER